MQKDTLPVTAVEPGADSTLGNHRAATAPFARHPTLWGRVDRLSAYAFATLWALPMAAWLCVFFVIPLVLLALMTFWTVDNFQLTARYNLENWRDFFTIPFFRVGYARTFVYATVTSAVATTLAFPFAYALAFKVSPGIRRLGMSLLITPFFTSYLVRSYAWQIILANNGIVNTALSHFGIGPVTLLNTPIATLMGMSRLLLKIAKRSLRFATYAASAI